jgi:hypothetical protein
MCIKGEREQGDSSSGLDDACDSDEGGEEERRLKAQTERPWWRGTMVEKANLRDLS